MANDNPVATDRSVRPEMRLLLRPLSLSPLLLVAACGGGGGGSEVVSTPPPPSYPKLADATASTTLATQAATYQFSRPGNASIPTLQSQASSMEISYDPTNQTYTLRGAPVIGSTTTITQSFGPSDAVSGLPGRYENITTTGSQTDVRKLGTSLTPSLTYTTYGSWLVGSTTSTDQTFATVYFTYGIPTKTSDMPKTGSASYTLQIAGEGSLPVLGSGTLTANFAASTVDVSLGLKAIETSRPGTTPYDLATVTGSGTIGAAGSNPGFTSSLAGGGYSGSLNGVFYGPQAAEVGGAFAITTSGGGMGPIAGVVVGKKN